MSKKIAVLLAATAALPSIHGSDLKILAIGNSFSICVGKNLPQIVHSVPGNSVLFCSAYIGGCPLSAHWNNIEALEKGDPKAAELYQVDVWTDKPEQKKIQYMGNVRDLLEKEKWDIITIQQASHESAFYERYQPWADNLIGYIRKKVPGARIVIQQTWSYRADDVRFNHDWAFDQTGMYDRLTAAYLRLAAEQHLALIPTGFAIQLARKRNPARFRVPSAEELSALRPPDLFSQANDPVGSSHWLRTPEGKMQIGSDSIHLNMRGEYLQACVWFSALYGISAEKITFDHPGFSAEESATLRKIAQEAVENFNR